MVPLVGSHVLLAGVGEPEISRKAYEVIGGGWLTKVSLGGGNKRIVVNGLGWIHMQTGGTLGADVFAYLAVRPSIGRMGPGRVAAVCPAAVLVVDVWSCPTQSKLMLSPLSSAH